MPQSVLHAISLTETGRRSGGQLRPWPWAINREGRGYWFATREEALAFAKRSLAEGRRSFDVGCFQINYHWHGHNFPSLESMFEPETGADYAARFLGDLHVESGNWSVAAGSYHSRTPHLARIYRTRFDRIHAGLSGLPTSSQLAEAPDAPRKIRTRMKRGPLIIRVAPRDPADIPSGRTGDRMAAIRTERIEKALPFDEEDTARADAVEVEAMPAAEPPRAWMPASGMRSFGAQ